MEVRTRHRYVSEHRHFKYIFIALVLRDGVPSLIHLLTLRVFFVRLKYPELLVHLPADIGTEMTPRASLVYKHPESLFLLYSHSVLIAFKKCIKRGRGNQCPLEGPYGLCKVVDSHRLLVGRECGFKQCF